MQTVNRKKRCAVWLGLSVFLAVLGWGVRQAELNGVGYTNDASLWVFFLAGVCVYAAILNGFILFRGHLKSRR